MKNKIVKIDTDRYLGYSMEELEKEYGRNQFTDEEKKWEEWVGGYICWGDYMWKEVKTITMVDGKRIETPHPNYPKLVKEKVPKEFQDKVMDYRNKKREWYDNYNQSNSLWGR